MLKRNVQAQTYNDVRRVRSCRGAAAVGLLLLLACLNVQRNGTLELSALRPVQSPSVRAIQEEDTGATNAQRVKQWRQNLRTQCLAAKSHEDLSSLSQKQVQGFTMPQKVRARDASVPSCRHVVMDFGANIGDTFGHVIDTGMISCDRREDLQQETPLSHFNIATKQFELVPSRNELTGNIERLLHQQAVDRGPEDYCYYGIEGNPHFTERLQELENYVMSIDPRPIKHAHFFTESVGAGEDGMTKLYLDTVNEKNNFWGSSIFKEHPDVQKSADGNDVEMVAVPVMGYTIGTLMRRTLKAFDPNSSAADKKGCHFLLKVDIEGGEYPLLDQAVADGTLCEFVKLGNTADLYIEFHSNVVEGNSGYVEKAEGLIDSLKECGVTFHNLDGNWA